MHFFFQFWRKDLGLKAADARISATNQFAACCCPLCCCTVVLLRVVLLRLVLLQGGTAVCGHYAHCTAAGLCCDVWSSCPLYCCKVLLLFLVLLPLVTIKASPRKQGRLEKNDPYI